MGRPVIHPFTLEKLTVASNYVLLVEREGPERLEDGALRDQGLAARREFRRELAARGPS